MSIPSIRGFQLDGSAIGDAAKSVNLYRGDVNLPLKLVSLAGPNGLNVSVSGYYGSNLGQQVTTWNREAPTGVLGLGWSMPFDNIVFDGEGTASWLEGSFTLNTGGNAHPLTLLSYSGTAAEDNESLTFADPLNPLWQFTYTPAEESWQVLREDGITMVFGDSSSEGDTVQWAVRWDNWAGDSGQQASGASRFALAWNLSTLTDPWGNQIRYAYLSEEQTVTGSLTGTRARRLRPHGDLCLCRQGPLRVSGAEYCRWQNTLGRLPGPLREQVPGANRCLSAGQRRHPGLLLPGAGL